MHLSEKQCVVQQNGRIFGSFGLHIQPTHGKSNKAAKDKQKARYAKQEVGSNLTNGVL